MLPFPRFPDRHHPPRHAHDRVARHEAAAVVDLDAHDHAADDALDECAPELERADSPGGGGRRRGGHARGVGRAGGEVVP